MPDYSSLNLQELEEELTKAESMLDDAKSEREFLGMQNGMHIVASEFAQIDRDIERFTGRIEEIKGLIAAKNGG